MRALRGLRSKLHEAHLHMVHVTSRACKCLAVSANSRNPARRVQDAGLASKVKVSGQWISCGTLTCCEIRHELCAIPCFARRPGALHKSIPNFLTTKNSKRSRMHRSWASTKRMMHTLLQLGRIKNAGASKLKLQLHAFWSSPQTIQILEEGQFLIFRNRVHAACTPFHGNGVDDIKLLDLGGF